MKENYWRGDFPILSREINGKILSYLDNAATTQKPESVIDAEGYFYRNFNSNINRGVHYLSQKATELYEDARKIIAEFLGASSSKEIVFTRGTTESINLVAHSWGLNSLQKGDEIVLTQMEHHANIVPWQLLAERLGVVLKWVPVEEDGSIRTESLQNALSDKTKLVTFPWVSNSLGTINPAVEWVQLAKKTGAKVLVDGAQVVSHFPINLEELGADFFVFSGHKLFGPTGTGVLWARYDVLESMSPYQGGGDMILKVTQEGSTFKKPPHRFEAGTPHYAGVYALGQAIQYLTSQDRNAIELHEKKLLEYATEQLNSVKGVQLFGTAAQKTSVLSFLIEGVHSHDVGTFLDQEGVAIRVGHHCTQPLMQRFGIPGTARASFAFYNDFSDVDRMIEALHKVIQFFKV